MPRKKKEEMENQLEIKEMQKEKEKKPRKTTVKKEQEKKSDLEIRKEDLDYLAEKILAGEQEMIKGLKDEILEKVDIKLKGYVSNVEYNERKLDNDRETLKEISRVTTDMIEENNAVQTDKYKKNIQDIVNLVIETINIHRKGIGTLKKIGNVEIKFKDDTDNEDIIVDTETDTTSRENK